VSKRDPQPDAPPPADAEADEEPNLSLEDTMAQKMRGVPTKSRTGVVGYNPYDAAAAKAKSDAAKEKPKPTDLRKLSEWIRLTRQVAELNQEKPEKPKDET
jgi:hypothetical protein